MEKDECIEHEEREEQGNRKRTIEQVEDEGVDNEGIKRLKSHNINEGVDDGRANGSLPEQMFCEMVENDDDKTNLVRKENIQDVNEQKNEALQVVRHGSLVKEGNDKDEETNELKNENTQDCDKKMKVVEQVINYSKKKKCVLLLSYCGSGYNGMQRNPGVRTIEEDLTTALFKARAISEDASRNYGKMSFQRCARTDKGVSAARQVVSMKHMVPYKELLPEINKHLEPQIRVFALKQVTRGFDCKSRCSSRVYEYLLPTFAFAPTYAHTTENFRITNDIINELDQLLKKYVGTKNFHNFTSGKAFTEESAKRYIVKFHVADEPFVKNNMEFLVMQVQGQSFMQHQIRKMIGLAIAIMKKYTGLEAVNRSFQQPKMDIPRAPGLGLVLDQVHFKSYNERFGRDGFHEPLEWSECEDQIKEFKKDFIYSHIIETEATTKSMMRWLSTLPTHTYSNVGMMELQDEVAGTSTETTVEEEKVPLVKQQPTCEESSSSYTTGISSSAETSVTEEPDISKQSTMDSSQVVVRTESTHEEKSTEEMMKEERGGQEMTLKESRTVSTKVVVNDHNCEENSSKLNTPVASAESRTKDENIDEEISSTDDRGT